MPQEPQQPLDIKHYLAIIERRKYIAIVVGLAVLSFFTWGSYLMPKTYEANTIVSIERGSLIKPLIEGVGVSGSIEDRLGNLKSEIMSRRIVEKTAKQLGLNTNTKDSLKHDALIENLREKIDVTVEGDRGQPNLFKISYRGSDPNTVAKMVNTITNVYIDEYEQSRRVDASDAYEFIQRQVLEYKEKLENSDKTIREFRERNPDLIPQSETTLLSRLETLQSQEIEAEIKMKELFKKRENMQKQLAGEKELTVALVTREGSPQARLNYLNNQLVLLMTKYTEDYPEVIKVKAEIEELKKQIAQAKISQIEGGSETATLNPIYQQLREEISRADAEIESLRARRTELSKQQQEIQRILGRMPKEQEEWTKLQRDRNVYQQIYDELLQKLENARVSQELELREKGESFRIVDVAKVPLHPAKPNRVKMILLGILLGIGSGLGAVFGLEYFDNSFKDEDSIETSLKLPVLATIPKVVTEDEEIAEKEFDRKVFIATGIYLSAIGIVLIAEFISRYMGIRIINF